MKKLNKEMVNFLMNELLEFHEPETALKITWQFYNDMQNDGHSKEDLLEIKHAIQEHEEFINGIED